MSLRFHRDIDTNNQTPENTERSSGGTGKHYGSPPEGAAHMELTTSSKPTLHIFQQEGGWHWGITVERAAGGGMKVVAYSDEGFDSEVAAREDGEHVLRSEDWRSRQSFSRSERRQGCT
jgi:hypothetical protein